MTLSIIGLMADSAHAAPADDVAQAQAHAQEWLDALASALMRVADVLASHPLPPDAQAALLAARRTLVAYVETQASP
jgi:hypothetical protein